MEAVALDFVVPSSEYKITASIEDDGMSVATYIPAADESEGAESAPQCLLVLSMAYHPNLVARVDGEIAPIYRTNYVLCGVPVPSGSHTVTVRYESKPLQRGLAISLLSALFALVLLAAMSRRNRKRGAADGA